MKITEKQLRETIRRVIKEVYPGNATAIKIRLVSDALDALEPAHDLLGNIELALDEYNPGLAKMFADHATSFDELCEKIENRLRKDLDALKHPEPHEDSPSIQDNPNFPLGSAGDY